MAHAASSKLAAGYSTIFSTARSSGGQPRVCRFSSYRLRTYQDLTFSLALIEILTKKNSHYTLRVFFFFLFTFLIYSLLILFRSKTRIAFTWGLLLRKEITFRGYIKFVRSLTRLCFAVYFEISLVLHARTSFSSDLRLSLLCHYISTFLPIKRVA